MLVREHGLPSILLLGPRCPQQWKQLRTGSSSWGTESNEGHLRSSCSIDVLMDVKLLASPVPRLIMLGLRFVSRHSAFMALGFLARVSKER